MSRWSATRRRLPVLANGREVRDDVLDAAAHGDILHAPSGWTEDENAIAWREAPMQRTLILDLDGTLIDSVPDLMAALNRLMAARGLAPYDRATTASFVGDGAHVLVKRAFAARGQEADEAAIEEFVTDYTANAAVDTRPFPGAVEAMRAMTEDGWKLAVCTNKPQAATWAVLDALDLSRWFSAVGGGDSFAARKPDPLHLLSTLAAAGGEPAASVMVGDHHNDVRAATGAGVPCIFAAWGYGPASMAEGSAAVAAGFADVPRLAAGLLPTR
jgi:phosphoglycolate phosphatase